ncbi:MAG: glycosyltransferase family 39 protein [Chloroflexi bacterium]|nr:glycosyltransferase family 39 protein [Chloroflexota bacterium]
MNDSVKTSHTSLAMARPEARSARWLGRTAPVLLGVLTFALVSLISRAVFPYLSNNHDEGVYIFHARLLEQGKLWAEASPFSESFRAWFIIDDGRKVYSKYAPVFPALLAAADVLFKDMRVVLALIGAGTVVAFYLVAQEMYRRHAALLASIFLVLSPLFLVQANVFLSYMLSFLLNLLFLLFFLKAVRRGGWAYPLLAGTFIGIGAFARPYTALLFALPMIGYTAYLLLRKRISLLSVACLVAGAVPFLALTLAYNHVMTGNALLFPYNAYEPDDKLGFGVRRFAPGLPDIVYTPSTALDSTIHRVGRLMVWVFGGPLMVLLAFVALRARRIRASHVLLLSLAATVVVGNALYWGNNPVFTQELVDDMGTFYYLDLLLPLCLLGARGFLDAVRFLRRPWRRLLAASPSPRGARRGEPSPTVAVIIALIIPLFAVNAYLAGSALDANYRYTVKHAAIYAPFLSGRLESALVFLPTPYGPFIHHPFGYLLNTPSFDGPVVYARNMGNRNLDLVRAMPDRRAYVYLYSGAYTERAEDVAPVSLLRTQPVEGGFLLIDMEAENPGNKPFVWAYVWNDEKTETYLVDDSSSAGKTYRFRWYVAADRLYFEGPNKGRVLADIRTLSRGTTLNVSVAFSPTRERKTQEIYEYRYWFAVKGDNVVLNAPGEPWRNVSWPDGAWVTADVSSALRGSISPVPGS